MRKRLLFILALLAVPFSLLQAEVLTLRSGAVIRGTILLQNEEVVILKTPEGLKYQYPATDIVAIAEETAADTLSSPTPSIAPTPKKVALLLDFAIGTACCQNQGWGTSVQANLAVGSHSIQGKRLFLGLGTGYHGYFLSQQSMNFIPVQFVARVPFLQGKNAPYLGANIGYAFSTNSAAKHGLCAGIDLGWMHAFNPRTALLVDITAQWQQTQLTITETVEAKKYTYTAGRNILGLAAKISLQF